MSKTSSTDLWTNLNSDTKLKFDWVSSYKDLSSNETKNSDTVYLFVIPQDFSKTGENADELYVIVEYTISYNDVQTTMKSKVYKQLKQEFKQGNAYTLNLTIGLTPIEFNANVTEWKTPADGDININSWE